MMNRNEDIRRAGMERLAPEQLPAIRLVCKHVGREEGTVSVRDALAWLEGLPEGCEPQSIDWGLLALVQDWSRAMDESLRQDVLPPILPLMPGTRDGGAGAGITALVRPRCLNWWLPGWLMLVSKFSHARSLERLDPASPAMDKLVLRIAGEIPPAEVSMEITRTAYKALHASGMGLAHFDPRRVCSAASSIGVRCAQRAVRGRMGLQMDRLVRRQARELGEIIRNELAEPAGRAG